MREARASALTGTLLILHDEALSRAALETTLASVLGAAVRLLPGEREPGHGDLAGARSSLQAVTSRLSQAGAGLSETTARFATSLRDRTAQSVRTRAKQATHGGERARAQPDRKLAPPNRGVRPDETAFHALSVQEVLGRVSSAPDGLAHAEAEARLASDGPNAIAPPARRSELQIFVDQLANTPVAMLGASSIASAAMGGFGDAAAILAVIGINASIGYVTESGAERTIAALTQTPEQTVPVMRDGSERALPVAQIVRGDVIALRAGIFVAADARVLSAHDLTVDESSLTGESIPVMKSQEMLDGADKPLADRVNMVYRGTLVTGGSGLAVVVATGARTELGHIQELAGAIEQRETPMQVQLDRLGKQLAIGAGAACLGMMGIGLLRGEALVPLLRTAVSLGVAAVPEGLPTVAMTTLALGLSRMREERVLIRQLSAVETLGATQVVCLDKTGTLTVNRMTVVAAQVGLESHEVRAGVFVDEEGRKREGVDGDLEALLRVAVLCNEVELAEQDNLTVLKGSPTESALIQVALDAGMDVSAERRRLALRGTQHRAQARNYMATTHEGEGGQLVAVKGRPQEVLALCSFVLSGGERRPLGDEDRAQIELANERMAGRALRVLGCAQLQGSTQYDESARELVWVGLLGMEDPPREGVEKVLASLQRAGVRTVMITGDQSATAQAVGRQIGLGRNDRLEIVDSTRLDSVPPELLGALAQRADVFSRVSPAHKLHIVRALQKSGMVVAMTGDGVNDGPALRAADIGIAMGAGGSVAARELADVVLEDDELKTLIFALEQGRTIYDDIRKAVRFILATNLSELLFTFTCVTTGVGEPLSPVQLLWINLLTDIFPELALATQPPEADVLSRPPRDPRDPMFSSRDLWRVALEGSAITAGALANYLTASRTAGPGPRAGTMGFSTLMFAQLLHAFSARSEHHSIFERAPIATSKWLPIAVGGTALLQLVMSFVPPLRSLLGIVPLGPAEWGKVAVGAVLPFVFNEGMKFALRTPHPALAADAAE